MTKYQAVRGTHDILPAEACHFQALEAHARALFREFCFEEIRTPTFESLDLFQRSIGETTDIVEKEMYRFEDRGGRPLALRPEGTAGVVRAFVEHHLSQSNPFCKLFYIGPMFRAERPQAGRYREFWQIGAEYFGNPFPEADAEMIILLQSFFKRLNLESFELKLNSLGDGNCRPAYRQALAEALEAEKPRLCADCRRRAGTNPLRVLDCKIDGSRMRSLPAIDAHWCPDCRKHFETVCALLDKAGVHYALDPRLMRGLDYYTRTVFEVAAPLLGAQDALAAGGRYDNLVRQLGGGDVPALGFALGSERTIQAMQASPGKSAQADLAGPLIFVASSGEEIARESFLLWQELRADNILSGRQVRVEGGFFRKKLAAQLSIADRIGATHCVILGPDELDKREVTLRSLKTSTQERVPRPELAQRLVRLLPHA